MKKNILIKSLFTFALIAVAALHAADPAIPLSVEDCLKLLPQLSTHGIAIEVEPRIIGKVDRRFSSDAASILQAIRPIGGGRLFPLFEKKPAPEYLKTQIQESTGNTVAASKWEDLAPEIQHAILAELGNRKQSTFFEDRRVAGMEVNPSLVVQWNRPVTLLGMQLEANQPYRLDISPFLNAGHLEFGGPEYVKDASLLEFHFRTDHLAGRDFLGTLKLILEGAGLQKQQIHVHVLGQIVRPEKDDSLIAKTALIHAEHWRRSNLAADLISVVNKQLSLVEFKDLHQGHLNWGRLDRGRLHDFCRDLIRFIRTGEVPRGDPYKMVQVAYHFPGKYEDPTKMGYQFRTTSFKYAEIFERLIDKAQADLALPNRGISEEELAPLLVDLQSNSVADVISGLWYPRTEKDLISVPTEIKGRLAPPSALPRILEEKAEKGQEAGMLAHDWSKDPVLLARKTPMSKIRELQLTALGELERAPYRSQAIVAAFLINSGIYAAYIEPPK